MNIKKIDISSIFPIIINIIKLSLELVSKLAKSISSIPYIAEVIVFVSVKIDNLNDFSKEILSNTNMLDNKNKLIIKDIKIKKEIVIFSFVIFLSEFKIFLFIMLLGLTNFLISDEADFNRI